MNSIILFSAAIFICSSSIAQESNAPKPIQLGKPYTLHVLKTDGTIQKGYLYSANADGITVTMKTNESGGLTQLAPEQIDKLFLRRKGNVGRGLLFGALSGAAIGALVGSSASNCNCVLNLGTKQDNTIIGAIYGGLTGAGLGLLLGALTKKKFIIKGKNENYKHNYQSIVERSMVK